MSICAPGRDALKQSCLTLTELQSVASLYNNEVKNDKRRIPTRAFASRELLIKHLNKRFNCKKRDCWINQDMVKSSQVYSALQSTAYKPAKPSSWKSNEREWLNTVDILKVMKQYEEKYKTFSFQGVFPINFTEKDTMQKDVCIVQKMCNFNIKDLKERGITCFGMVLNLDRHNEPGSHWVSIFCCLDPSDQKYGICYYDSGGSTMKKISKYVKEFIKTVVTQVNDRGKFRVKHNHIRHQFQDTECGIFAMLFIILCLRSCPAETYMDVKNKMPNDKNDDGIHKYRSFFYREDSSSG